jgi:hypothetical protein
VLKLKKYLLILLISIFIFGTLFSSSIAGATENKTTNKTTSQVSKNNASCNLSENRTTQKIPVTEQKFRVGPTVILRPVTDIVTKGQDGLVELYMDNPTLNDVTLNVDARISVPSGVQVYGQGFGQADAAGTVYGTFSVPPGTVRTININIKGEKVGTYTVHFSGMYWPGDCKDNYNPISLTHPFEVKEGSTNAGESSNAGNDTEGVKGNGSFSIPGFEALIAVVGFMGIYISRRNNQGK